MKKILLVNANTEKMPYPVPPLGLCLLASCLQSSYEVKIYDGVFDEGRTLTSQILQFCPDFIGVSIRNIDNMVIENPADYTSILLERFIKPIKSVSLAPLILGGSGFSIYPAELMQRIDADYGICGEGEALLLLLLNLLSEGKEVSHIPGIFTRNGGITPACRPDSSDNRLDLVPANIDLHIDFEPYRRRGAYSIQTKRGCAHHCIYCTYPLIEGRMYRLRDPMEIAEEIEQAYHRLGFVTFEFVDSTFNDPKGHAEAICREIIKRNIKARFRTMGINPLNTSAELFYLMQKAGFAQMDCTPDSASPTMIANLKKNFTLRQLEDAARLIKETGMPTMWFFLFGGPGENEKTFNETLEFIDKWIDPYDLVHLTVGLRVYPNTGLHAVALAEGKISKEDTLFAPCFYVSDLLGQEKLNCLINLAALQRPNCLPVWDSAPSPEMLMEAMEMQQQLKLNEPMFRTLLKIRYRDFDKIKVRFKS